MACYGGSSKLRLSITQEMGRTQERLSPIITISPVFLSLGVALLCFICFLCSSSPSHSFSPVFVPIPPKFPISFHLLPQLLMPLNSLYISHFLACRIVVTYPMNYVRVQTVFMILPCRIVWLSCALPQVLLPLYRNGSYHLQ